MDLGVILGGVSLMCHLVSVILSYVNHSRLRSHCCGKEGVVSLDIDSTRASEPRSKLEGTEEKTSTEQPSENESSVDLEPPWAPVRRVS